MWGRTNDEETRKNMPATKLLQMVREEDFDGFENYCLEALEQKTLRLGELVAPFEEMRRQAHADRAAALGQMVLETVDPLSDAPAALDIARIALFGDPKNDQLRQSVIELYRTVHGDKPGFAALLDASGLTKGRPARNALRMIDICLALRPGEALISRTEDVVVEVVEVDLEHGLITLQHPQRRKTITPIELSREYDHIAPDDFRVLRALRPEQLAEMLESNPVAVIVGLIHAHGDMISQDVLKSELVPKYISAKAWSKWWTRARHLCQRDPHVILEGRNPVMLRYTADVWTVEDATWDTFEKQHDPADWHATIEGYLREKKKNREQPEIGLLVRCQEFLRQHRGAIQQVRPSDALGCALVSARIGEVASDLPEDGRAIALEALRGGDAVRLIAGLTADALWQRALELLPEARPEDAGDIAAALFSRGGSAVLDTLVQLARDADRLAPIQRVIDDAVAEPVSHPEIIFWLWKGPRDPSGLRLPPDDELFTEIIHTLSALGRSLNPPESVMKRFRQRVRGALALRNHGRAVECLRRISPNRAITLRRQLERLEGVGPNLRTRLLNALRDVHPDLFVVHQQRVEPWDDPNVLWNTGAGIDRKTKERDHLVNVTMHENAKRIGEAASHGDLSENSEYKFALEERDFLRARLARMNHDLSMSREIEPQDVPTDHVGIGSRVTLRNTADGSTRVMTFLGPFDTDIDKGIYNYRAPFSLALMGMHVGERTTLTLDNQEVEFEIVEITNGLAAPASQQA